MAFVLKTHADFRKLKALDRATLVEIIITPAALSAFVDRTKLKLQGHYKDRTFGKREGYRMMGDADLAGAIRRSQKGRN